MKRAVLRVQSEPVYYRSGRNERGEFRPEEMGISHYAVIGRAVCPTCGALLYRAVGNKWRCPNCEEYLDEVER